MGLEEIPREVSLKKANPGKAAILSLGKAFPHQLVMQEFLVDGYFRNTNCDDPDLKQKLTRLCNSTASSVVLFLYLRIVLYIHSILCRSKVIDIHFR